MKNTKNQIKTISLNEALKKSDYENNVKNIMANLLKNDFGKNIKYLFKQTSKIALPNYIIIIKYILNVPLKGKNYDIPLLIYFPDSFPLSAPEIYLEKKSNHIQINKSIPNYFISQKDLRVNFQLYKKWKKVASSIHEIIEFLINIFSRFFPLFYCKEENNFSGYCEIDYNQSILIVENNNNESNENKQENNYIKNKENKKDNNENEINKNKNENNHLKNNENKIENNKNENNENKNENKKIENKENKNENENENKNENNENKNENNENKNENNENNEIIEYKIFEKDEYNFIKEKPLAISTFYDIKLNINKIFKDYKNENKNKENIKKDLEEIINKYDLEITMHNEILDFYFNKYLKLFEIKEEIKENNNE